jgi:hypothetical protein
MEDTTTLLFALAVAIVVLLVAREVVCWYYKMNAVVSLLERIDKRLASVDGHVATLAGSAPARPHL